MKAVHWFGLLLLAVALAVVGCGGASDTSKKAAGQHTGGSDKKADEAAIKANLAKLSPEDRKLAKAQATCPISGEPLGEMDVPVKVMIEGQPVFLCCGDCRRKAKAHPEETLAKVKELRAKTTAP